ncbi:MAG: response regulator, partial [Chloroflexi bacterium]|nr:response regulator [Chloroflexota bacterium]
NSLLILARMLTANNEGNLTPEQVESAQIVYNGGIDLLNLINDILDLSKVEAGKLELHFAPMSPQGLVTAIEKQFAHVAEDKGLAFQVSVANDMPDTIETDQQRVQQIIKNLLSNAFKFTEQGSIRLDIYRPQPNIDLRRSGLDLAQAIAISVTDTGIGMTPEQQKIVFEAFQQADGSTSRQYGGTGLGLSISRELATKLGGQIELVSAKGKGSSFTLYLPIARSTAQKPRRQTEELLLNGGQEAPAKISTPALPSPPSPLAKAPARPMAPPLADDRDNLQAGDQLLLIIEDDLEFAKLVFRYAHKKNFKCLVAGDGETGLYLAQTYKIDAIILDLMLPGISGWQVLDTLKNNPDTRHIPVHIMSALDEDLDAYKRGAIGFLTKPVGQEVLNDSFQRIEQFIARKIKSLLLVEDDANLRKSVWKLLEGQDVAISEASLGQSALEQLASQHFDCMILDLTLPDMSGFELLNRLDTDETLSKCPVIVYTGKALTEEEHHELLKFADSVIVKGVKSPERLLDETALFLHRIIANMPEEKQRTIKRLYDNEALLVGKQILIVDDDARNAFALSKLLADKGLKAHIASNGQKALDLLDKTPVDLVLMDIMMPGIDGYEVTRRIRTQQQFRSLPILALTAKAMSGDREKCIAVGASDYLSKPIDPDRLFSMLRVWLNRE